MPKLCVLPGDGIGKEVIPAAVSVLMAVVPNLGIIQAEAGWETFAKTGNSVPAETLIAIRECGAALFGAVSSPSRKVEGYRSAILTLRQELNLFANIRPVKSMPRVSPKPGIDMIIVRENSEGLYAGRETTDGETAVAERVITKQASRRIAKKGLEVMNSQHRQKLTIVHKANVLPLTDGLFRDSVREVCEDHSDYKNLADLKVDELLVDVAALKILAEPEQFDVIITTNLFGDILSDAASYWGGGLGLAPSLNWGNGIAIAEPVHGSAPDIAGKGIANPIATILSAALLLRYVWQMEDMATGIETAINKTLANNEYENFGSTQAILKEVLKNL